MNMRIIATHTNKLSSLQWGFVLAYGAWRKEWEDTRSPSPLYRADLLAMYMAGGEL